MNAKVETVKVVALRGYFPADGSKKMAKYGSKTEQEIKNGKVLVAIIPEPRDLPKSEALPLIKAGILKRVEDL